MRHGFTHSPNTRKAPDAYIEDRVLRIAHYIVESGATVRSAAGKFNVSKSTVHMVVIK